MSVAPKLGPSMEHEIFDGYLDLAAEALDGIAFQSAAAGRFLRRGDVAAALEAYRRIVALHREFAAPNMRAIALATVADADLHAGVAAR